MASILIISEDNSINRTISSCFPSHYAVVSVSNKEEGIEALRQRRFDFIFIDILLLNDSGTGNNYKQMLQPFWLTYPTVEIIVMSTQEMIREAVKAVKAGASNYLTFPTLAEEVKYVIENIKESQIVQSELDYLRDQLLRSDTHTMLTTGSLRMRETYGKIRSVAPTVSTVLLVGETGTGKGVLARLIHQLSNRGNAQFISVHCGAIPETLIESELFGHEKGAFTGAVRRKLGKFEIAKDGTIFLDEVATISSATQIKLLQVLQDRIMQRVGGESTIEVNSRIIAATNMDLMQMCNSGQFRKDLYYRLNVFPVEIPSLKDRREDIPLLVDTFIRKLNKLNFKEIHGIHPEVLSAFEEYSWPGNIRELENLVERAYIIESSSMLMPTSFPAELFSSQAHRHPDLFIDPSKSLAEFRRIGMNALEKSYLHELLSENRGRLKAAARSAGITTRQLYNLMKKYDFRKEDFKRL